MTYLNNIQAVYFLGIGGIGMSALARYFHNKNKWVAGYDRTPSDLTNELSDQGIQIHYTDSDKSIPEELFRFKKEEVLVVYTPAIPSDHQEKAIFTEKGYNLVKRAEVLGLITQNSKGIGIAGTHGKTTTSAITAHLLHCLGSEPTAFVGGIMVNYGTNFLLGEGSVSVMEADEFDRSFLKLSPSVAVITSVDADHLDIYGNEDSFRQGFLLYAKRLNPDGTLIVHESVKSIFSEYSPITYGISDSADVKVKNVRVINGQFVFDLEGLLNYTHLILKMGGRHNVLNAVAAITACHFVGMNAEKIPAALSSFEGVKRRFERIVENDRFCYIDDYAHHPMELDACISAARELYPDKRIFGAFQPHLFTRTRDFSQSFSKSLSALDHLFLLPIYPAREIPIEGVSSEMLLDEITCSAEVVEKHKLAEAVQERLSEMDVFITMGAGDIDREVINLKKVFSNEG